VVLGFGRHNPVMIDADGIKCNEEPQLPFTRAFRWRCWIALIWTIVLISFMAVKTSAFPTAITTLVSVVTGVTLVIGIFQRPEFPAIDPKITRGIVATVLIADFVGSVGWIGWSYYQANRTVDVLSTVTLGQNIDVLPDGHATLDLAVTAQRDTVVLVFQIVDHSSTIGSCVPNTSLSVTPDAAGNRGRTVAASSGGPTSVDLPSGTRKLHLDIAVTNTRGDRNCSVDLSVVSAKLQNK
jgi:hypothetical protein